MTADGAIDFGDVDLADAHVTSVTPGGSGYFEAFVARLEPYARTTNIQNETRNDIQNDEIAKKKIGVK